MANTNANKYLGAGLGLLLLSFCFMAGAEDLTGTAWDLDTLQKQRVLYEAQAAVKKAQAEAEGVGEVSAQVRSHRRPARSVRVCEIQCLPHRT